MEPGVRNPALHKAPPPLGGALDMRDGHPADTCCRPAAMT